MARIELELDDKGDVIGDTPAEIDAIFKRIEAAAHGQGYGKGVQKAAEDAKKQIEDAVKAKLAEQERLAPLEKEKYARADEENKSLKAQLLEREREHDRTLKTREETHAKELLERADALKKRNAKITDLLMANLRAEASKAGARDESLDELVLILKGSIGYDDEMDPFVKNADGTQKMHQGKAQSVGAFVKEYIDSHPHHRRPNPGQGGGARGGATLHGHPGGVPTYESAKARIDAGDRSAGAINELFESTRKK